MPRIFGWLTFNMTIIIVKLISTPFVSLSFLLFLFLLFLLSFLIFYFFFFGFLRFCWAFYIFPLLYLLSRAIFLLLMFLTCCSRLNKCFRAIHVNRNNTIPLMWVPYSSKALWLGQGSSEKCWSCKHEVLSLDSQHSHKKLCRVFQTYNPCTGEVETGGLLGLIKELVSKYKMESDWGRQMMLTSGLHLHTFTAKCVYRTPLKYF